MYTNYLNEGFIVKSLDGKDEVVMVPYNINNFLVSEEEVQVILERYNVQVDKLNHIEYFRQAFTHKSYCKKDIYPQHILDSAKIEMGSPVDLLELRDKSYERLEWFGDRVLKIIVSFYLFHRYPKQPEGFLTRLQTKIEDKKNLAIMSKEIGLDKFFIISKQIEINNGRNLEKIHEDVFEAFIGALFLSNGFEPCMYLIVNLLETLIDYSEKLYCDNNYKDKLLRVHHEKGWKTPVYTTIHFEGPPHKRKYVMGVEKNDCPPDESIENRCIAYGIGNSKKEGEQNASKMALIIYGYLKDDQYNQNDIYYPPWNKIKEYDGESMIIDGSDIIEIKVVEMEKQMLDMMADCIKEEIIQEPSPVIEIIPKVIPETVAETVKPKKGRNKKEPITEAIIDTVVEPVKKTVKKEKVVKTTDKPKGRKKKVVEETDGNFSDKSV